ncbi:MAG TPA: hypothetical protein DDZ88_12625 [Verrucomicrobiales bacterium]|nr:hypothetical protein [Verrucomicrobiales bacterium]
MIGSGRSMSSKALAHKAQAFVCVGGHRQAEGLGVDAEVAQLALPTNVGDFDAMGGKEARDFLIAGVSAHGWMLDAGWAKEKTNAEGLGLSGSPRRENTLIKSGFSQVSPDDLSRAGSGCERQAVL